MKVNAAVVHSKGAKFEFEELTLEEPRHDEVLVKVVGVGLCHLELTVRDQWYPVPLPSVLGHEGSGIVEKVGAGVRKVKPGDHVVLSYLSCGTCENCLKGQPAYCLALYPCNFCGARLDGSTTLSKGKKPIHGSFFGQSSFATYALASERNVVKVRTDVPLELLGPLGCGIQTGAGAVLNSLHPHAGSSIAVFGAGSVGLSAIMAAVVSGCTPIIAVDLNDSRLELARSLGATHTINPAKGGDLVQEVQKITNGGANFTVETTGSPKVFRQAVDALQLTGVCGLIGGSALGTEVTLDMNNILFGRSVRGVIEGDSVPDLFIPKLIELYREGRFPFDRLVRFYPFSEINTAVADSEKGVAIKAVLRME
ncbi:MAG TPA: NAD(P)-dependent alcohol dehydrogenase [Candidatus Deferrimicrobiaceae bacterium]